MKEEIKRKGNHTTHGLSRTKEYNTWIRIRNRCQNPKCQDFIDYGGRGITVCNEWNESFITFLNDVGPAPSKGHSLDRKDNDGNYEPSNCRWATPRQQANNTRRNVIIEYRGQKMTFSQWIRFLNLPLCRTKTRYENKWPIELVFSAEKFKAGNKPGCLTHNSKNRTKDQTSSSSN